MESLVGLEDLYFSRLVGVLLAPLASGYAAVVLLRFGHWQDCHGDLNAF